MARWTKSIHAASRGYAREMAKRRSMHIALGRAAKVAAAGVGIGAATSATGGGSAVAGAAAGGAAVGSAPVLPFIFVGAGVVALGALIWSVVRSD